MIILPEKVTQVTQTNLYIIVLTFLNKVELLLGVWSSYVVRYYNLNLGIFGRKEENGLHIATIGCQDRAQF